MSTSFDLMFAERGAEVIEVWLQGNEEEIAEIPYAVFARSYQPINPAQMPLDKVCELIKVSPRAHTDDGAYYWTFAEAPEEPLREEVA